MRVTAHQLDTHYERIGDGSPLVLLHGWGHDWQTWSPVIAPLSTHFQLVIPDLPAFGQTANPLFSWTSAEYVLWLKDFVQKVLPRQKFAVLGHSFGGKVAALYAATAHDSQLTKLIVMDASGLPDPLPNTKKFQQHVLRFVPESLKNALPLSLKAKVLQRINSPTDHLNSTKDQRAILRATISENIGQTLKNIHIPTLIIWGQNDLDTPLHQGQQFHDLISGSELSIFAHSGHFPFIDETDHFVKELESFL